MRTKLSTLTPVKQRVRFNRPTQLEDEEQQ